MSFGFLIFIREQICVLMLPKYCL